MLPVIHMLCRLKIKFLILSYPILKKKKKNTRWHHICMKICGSHHAKTYLQEYADSEGQISLRIRSVWSGQSLSANRIVGYHKVFQWRTKEKVRLRMRRMMWKHILCMLEGIFSTDAAHVSLNRWYQERGFLSHLWTAKTQISLSIHAVWSGP